MLASFIPFITPILITVGFWQIFNQPTNVFVVGIISIILILITGKILAKHNFIRFFRLWINLSLVYLAQVLFMIVLTSNNLRYGLAILWLFIWVLVFWLLSRYFVKLKDINDLDYLSFNRFLYYLSFWLLAVSLFHLIIFINFSVVYSIIFLLIAIYWWGKEILMFSSVQLPKFSIWLLLLTSLELLLVLYLAPLSFYVAGTIITVWVFFLLELLLLGSRHFIRYLLLFLVVIAILLVTLIL
ncbi:hypothetical protein HOD19_03985 [bacterium]|jgi:hypothetical protein|nr:hypothetical protein [bacterium]